MDRKGVFVVVVYVKHKQGFKYMHNFFETFALKNIYYI